MIVQSHPAWSPTPSTMREIGREERTADLGQDASQNMAVQMRFRMVRKPAEDSAHSILRWSGASFL
jgi:hypothetical protein